MIKKLGIILLILCLASPCFGKARWYNATGLIGGTSGMLDAINGQNLVDLDRAIVTTTTAVYFYYLDDDSGTSESPPNTISPDSNAGDKRWILIQSITP